MKKAELERQYTWIVKEVRELRETSGWEDDRIRCFLIGVVTAGDSCYTSSQHRRIFHLVKR